MAAITGWKTSSSTSASAANQAMARMAEAATVVLFRLMNIARPFRCSSPKAHAPRRRGSPQLARDIGADEIGDRERQLLPPRDHQPVFRIERVDVRHALRLDEVILVMQR